jgi:DNA polymerase (family 10)
MSKNQPLVLLPTFENCADLLSEMENLLTLKGENVFKVRAFGKAADRLRSLAPASEELKARAEQGTLTEWEGIGKGISATLTEYITTGKSSERDTLQESLPKGLLEFTQIPGLGPKKALAIIEELEIHTLGELEYACRENRLLNLKGFGEKAQAKILEGIRFMQSTTGQKRLDEVLEYSQNLRNWLEKAVNRERHPGGGKLRVSEVGEIRRRAETLSRLEYLIETPLGEKSPRAVKAQVDEEWKRYTAQSSEVILPVEFHYAPINEFPYEQARLTASEPHWSALQSPPKSDAETEEELYRSWRLEWVPPECRETGLEVKLARDHLLEKTLLPPDGVRGVFHNHTTRSDGAATLEEMVVEAKRLGYSYIGISDHSQSAFYAQGLKEDTLLTQEKEIRSLQDEHPEIRIFWGIESDILADGGLDYPSKVLKRFDFVIASIHSRFGMDRDAMTERMIKAIQNPATRFVGHLTGRILLGRKGYELDMEKVLKEAAAHDVAIELNAHPSRLDIDWRYGPQMRELGVKTSINPDAHELRGLQDVRYGVFMARKALIPAVNVVNSWGVKDVAKWLIRG